MKGLLHALAQGETAQSYPALLAQNKAFQELLAHLIQLQRCAASLSRGDLSQDISMRCMAANSLKSLQTNLRHLIWQMQRVARGDFTQRVDFMGEFSAAFNHMVENLANTEIENARLYEQARQHAAHMTMLYEIGMSITSRLKRNEIMKSAQSGLPYHSEWQLIRSTD